MRSTMSAAAFSSSSAPTPRRIAQPWPISPTTEPSTRTRALLTRWQTARNQSLFDGVEEGAAGVDELPPLSDDEDELLGLDELSWEWLWSSWECP